MEGGGSFGNFYGGVSKPFLWQGMVGGKKIFCSFFSFLRNIGEFFCNFYNFVVPI